MEILRAYLNALSLPDQVLFARRCGTTIGYLRKLLAIGNEPREKLCARIEVYTGGAVTRRDLRPDDWRDIWPELQESDPNPPPALAGQAPAAAETAAGEET